MRVHASWRVVVVGVVFTACLQLSATNAYKGPDGGYLNDPDNWNAAIPTTDWLGFKNVPSREYTVKLSADMQTNGGLITDGGSHTVHFDLAPYTFRALGHYYQSREYVTNILESGQLTLMTAAGVTNNVSFSDESNSRHSAFVVRNKGTKLIGNLNIAHGYGNSVRVEKGARVDGAIGVLAASNTVYVTGAGTVVDFHSPHDGRPKTVADTVACTLLLGAHENRTGCEHDCRMYITDGAMVTNVTGLRVGGGNTANRAGIDCLLCVSNATFHMTRTSSGNVIGGTRPDAHGNRVEFIDGAQVVLGGSGSGNALNVGESGSCSNSLYVAGEGTFVSNGWANADGPVISGANGAYNVIEITDHAYAKIGGLASGGQVKSSKGAYTSLWNRVTISNGAVVETSALVCGNRHSDQRAVAYTSEVASNLLEITSGAIVTNTSNGACVGQLAPFRDNVMRVTGAGTHLATKSVVVGAYGARGNRFEIADGATVKSLTGGSISVSVPGSYGGSNNVFAVKGATCTVSTLNLGVSDQSGWTTATARQLWCGTGGNALEVGAGADLSVATFNCYGADCRIVVSNGTLKITNGITVSSGAERLRCRFEGSSPEVKFSGGNGSVFGPGAVLTFAIPRGGYTTVPFTSGQRPLAFAADASLDFELSNDLYNEGGRVTLMSATSKHFAAEAGWLAAQEAKLPRGCRLYFSKDGTDVESDPTKANYLMLRVPKCGTVIILR